MSGDGFVVPRDFVGMDFAVVIFEEAAVDKGEPNFAIGGAIGDAVELGGLAGNFDGGESAAIATDDAAGLGADPQSAGAIFPGADDAAAVHGGCVVGIEDGEADAVEAHEAVEGGEPEVAVVRLGHRDDGILRKAVVGLPGVDKETFGRARGFCGIGGRSGG